MVFKKGLAGCLSRTDSYYRLSLEGLSLPSLKPAIVSDIFLLGSSWAGVGSGPEIL